MEEQIRLIIRILCEEEGGQQYYVNYPSIESFKSRGILTSQAWGRVKRYLGTWQDNNIWCCELNFYQTKDYIATDHIATLLVDLVAKGANWSVKEFSEVQLINGREWLVDGESPKGTPGTGGYVGYGKKTYIYYTGEERATAYWSIDALSKERETILPDRKPLIEAIGFVTNFVISLQGFRQLNESVRKGEACVLVGEVLTDYAILNPGIFNELGLPDQKGGNINIPRVIWQYHEEQFKELTRRGCISVSNNFRHDDLDTALKIAVNPLLVQCYEELDKCTGAANKIAKLNEIFSSLTQAQGIDLTGADFESAIVDLRDADSADAKLESIKWPLVEYADKVFHLPKLNWDKYGADFILQQLEQLGQKPESEISIEEKQAWAKALFDKVLSNIHTSKELVKFVALIDGKEDKFAYLRQETEWFRGSFLNCSFFKCHGNTDTWRDILLKLKVHLDILLVDEIYKGTDQNAPEIQDIPADAKKEWETEKQLNAFHKIMAEHRGRWFGEVTHTKLYRDYSEGNKYYTDLNKDMKELRDSYINKDASFKNITENASKQKKTPF